MGSKKGASCRVCISLSSHQRSSDRGRQMDGGTGGLASCLDLVEASKVFRGDALDGAPEELRAIDVAVDGVD